MGDRVAHDVLIGRLAAKLRPVRPLRPPLWRAALWVVAGFMAGVLLYVARAPADPEPNVFVPWTLMSLPVITSICAAIAAFQVSMPDRSSYWAWLPLPALGLWMAASGWGCLASIGAGGLWGETVNEAVECLVFMLGIAVPLGVLVIVMLQRARPLRFMLTTSLGGLATGAGAASLLALVHPHNGTPLDLAFHAIAIVLVVIALHGVGHLLRSHRTPA